MRWLTRLPPALLLLAACGSEPTLAGGDTTPEIGHIFFSRTDLAPGAGGGGSLHMTIDNQFNAVPVAPRQAAPVASPDGRYIAWLVNIFPATFGEYTVTRLYVYDRRTGDTTRVLTDADRPGSLSWSRHPLRLGFTRSDATGGEVAFLTAAPNGSDIRVELAAGLLDGASPALSSDAASVAVVKSVPLVGFGPQHRLETIGLGDGVRRFLTAAPDSTSRAFLGFPVWSPEGRYLAVVQHELASDRIWLRVIDWQGVIRHELEVVESASWPSWSPDGRQVVFCRYVAEPALGRYFYRQEIAVWTVRTGAVQVITPEGKSDCFPSWTR